MTRRHVIVVGAGIGGLSAALDLASSGLRVTLLERHNRPGGKMRDVKIGAIGIDSGPTVFTMRWVFEDLFRDAGLTFGERVPLVQSDVLARHSWPDRSRLDLYADVERSADAIAAFAGPGEADAYRRFAAESERIFQSLDHTFMRRERPGPVTLALSNGLRGLPELAATKPFRSLWSELGRTFKDQRLQQLFGRYATYCGSSPFKAPATLMLIAHAERAGVWQVSGGMQRLAEGLASALNDSGVSLHFGTGVRRIVADRRGVRGVELDDGPNMEADAVVFNGDVAALSDGLLGPDVTRAVRTRRLERRSLSAMTWSFVGRAKGFPLDYHTVFFGSDYPDEFDSIFRRRTVTAEPTVYVCAQDRGAGAPRLDGPERLFMLVNAPPRPFTDEELHRCEESAFNLLQRQGLSVDPVGTAPVRRSPNDFAARFPGTGGAIYGWPTHGMFGSFRRQGSRSRIPGLYLAGGTVHPGPGVPMTALSGRLAAASVRADLGA